MTPFNIISLADYLSESEIDTVLESFADLYFQVTSKHQRRMKLYVIADEVSALHVKQSAAQFKLERIIEVIPAEDKSLIKKVYQAASVMFLPLQSNIGEIIPEALAFVLPVLCYDTEEMKEYLDQTCGMFVRPRSFSQSIIGFIEKIRR